MVLKYEYSGFIIYKEENKHKDISKFSSWILTNKCENPERFSFYYLMLLFLLK